MNKWIKKDDTVVVQAGNEKGNTGKVLFRKDDQVLIEGLNKRTKHIKKSQANPQGGKVEMETPMHISNVALCDGEGKPIKKLSTRTNASGDKVLVSVLKDGDKELRVLRKAKKND